MLENRVRKKILGINVDFNLTMPDVVAHIDSLISKKDNNYLISTTNPYFIMAAQKDRYFAEIVNSSELSIPDGVGVLYAKAYLDVVSNKNSKFKNIFLDKMSDFLIGLKIGFVGFLKKLPIGEPLTGVDLSEELFKLANDKGYSVFLLGGRPRDVHGQQINDATFDMATKAAEITKNKYPNITIVGATSAFSREKADDQNTMKYIHYCMSECGLDKIDILLVAYNPVDQEKWIHRNAKNVPATISVGIGRTFDYITGYMRRTPLKWEKAHLGWLYPFIIQPWRIKRLFMTFPLFPLKVFLSNSKNS